MSQEAAAPRMVEVTTTYVHLPTPEHFRPTFASAPDLLMLEAHEPQLAFYRFLYDYVGRDYNWTSRLAWSDDRLREHLARPEVTVLPFYVRGTPAGYIELNAAPGGDEGPGTEVVHFGLAPAFHSRGLGKHFLSVGVARAFADGASRVWLHTCTLDGPHALANYQARGFIPYRSTTELETLSDAAYAARGIA